MNSLDRELLSTDSEAPFTPLAEITDRRQAMSRFIGPMVNAMALTAIDGATARHAADPITLEEYCGESELYETVTPWLGDKKSFSSSYEATVGLAIIATKIIGNTTTVARDLTVPAFTTLTANQQTLLDNFDSEVRESDLHSLTYSNMDSQAGITFQVALPGYLVKEFGASNPKELRGILNMLSLDEVVDILKSTEFSTALLSMPFAPNGTYGGFDTDLHLTEADIQSGELRYGVATELVELITPELYQQAEVAGLLGRLAGVKFVFSLYDLFEYKQNRSLGLSAAFVKATRTAIRLESLLQTNADGLTPTDGCPAARKQTKIRLGDFTTAQLGKLLSGVTPIAKYDPATQFLTMLRNPISELNELYVTALQEACE